MKLLLVHNRYQQYGGEDGVFDQEAALLERSGLDVRRLTVSNDGVRTLATKIAAAASIGGSSRGIRLIADALDRERPDLVHVHNVFPLLSPAIFRACKAKGYPVVHTLHNYRTVCANGFLMRDGHVCEDCLDGSPFHAALHRCYRGSALGSAAVARGIRHHRVRGTWRRDVDRFIALTGFARRFFMRAGFPGDRIVVKPNFAPDPGPPDPTMPRAGFLFVGRLSREKGVDVLLDALAGHGEPVVIVGDGPERARLQASARPNVVFTGRLGPEEVKRHMRRSLCLIVPSTWYEGFPLVVAEAYANGLPVIASDIGSLSEICSEGGLLFRPGDAAGLRSCAATLLRQPDLARRLGVRARGTYETCYSPRASLQALKAIYADVLGERWQAPVGIAVAAGREPDRFALST